MNNMKRYFGCHVSVAGGLVNGLKNGQALGINAIQIHPTPPQRWNLKPFSDGYEDEFLNFLPSSGIEKVFFHAIYLINLASLDQEKKDKAIISLRYYLELMDRIDGAGVVFHVGSNKDQENDMAGFKQAAEAINEVLKEIPKKSKLLLEVSAGSGRVIGASLEDLRIIADNVSKPEHIGFALDTQHMWASGYDIKDNCEHVVEQIDSVFGFENVHVIHLNDSKTTLASHVDRHENLGQGNITKEGLKNFINHPKIKSIPLILETPAMGSIETAKEEVAVLREMVEE